MADYNIYIHNVSGGENVNTTPFQTQGNMEGFSGATSSAFSNAKMAASFIENPDSLINTVKSNSVGGVMMAGGKIGIALWAINKLREIAMNSVSNFLSISTNATGESKALNDFNNVNTFLTNILNPLGTQINHQKATLEIRKKNAADEQNMKLFGGTIINSQYGRYL